MTLTNKTMGVETFPLLENERLSSIKKQHHSRKKLAYIAEDKLRNYVILSQRISDIVSSINSIVTDDPDKVSLTGIYMALGRRGSTVKHRWRVQFCELEGAAEAFEARRAGVQHALIVGDRGSYQLA